MRTDGPHNINDLIRLNGEHGDAAAGNILDMLDLGELTEQQATPAKIQELYFAHEPQHRYIA